MVIAMADVPRSPFVSYAYRRPPEPLRESDGNSGAATNSLTRTLPLLSPSSNDCIRELPAALRF